MMRGVFPTKCRHASTETLKVLWLRHFFKTKNLSKSPHFLKKPYSERKKPSKTIENRRNNNPKYYNEYRMVTFYATT